MRSGVEWLDGVVIGVLLGFGGQGESLAILLGTRRLHLDSVERGKPDQRRLPAAQSVTM